jgi:hypothetical protein
MKRFIFDCMLFISVFTLPWYATIIIAIIGVFLFYQFYEFIIAIAVSQSLFAVNNGYFFTKSFWFFITAIVLYMVMQLIRNSIIFYKR